MQPTMLSKVLLPEPDEPTTAVKSPALSFKLTPRNAGVSILPSWYDLCTDFSSTRVSPNILVPH